ncbi:hypothetical protein LTR36_005218 [Oleoguttula mirabilis]|uniref:Uncharacterized protein n=1 Tax=Oleoguttula mirabilis TaxID=1507867 RepID=A0AAV9JXW5_9PEZI|nr:hypothetical protein LTR36_005218 [Oleoguttula mirabilis]
MDADVAQMMADLGLARRDFVSAPAADARGRLVREDPHLQEAILADIEAHRARAQTRNAGSAIDGRGEKLKAWNTDTTFERDSVTDQLENRFSGQGHRANLSSKHGTDPRWEKTETRYGEERRIYLQDRAAGSGGNYVASAAPRHGFGGGGQATPRSFASGSGGSRAPERGRVASAPNPNRAPSPRSFGTVRFAPGNRRIEATTSGSRIVAPPPSAPAAMRSSATTTATRATAPTRTSQQPAMRTVATTASTQHRPASAISAASTTCISTGTTIAGNSAHDMKDQARFAKLAEWYAANPGAECDTYYVEYPDRKPYHRPAWIRLVKLAFMHAKDPHGNDTATYLSTHKDREWIFAAAMTAKDFVENRTDADTDAYAAANPAVIDFCKAARFYCKPKVNTSIAQPEPTTSESAVLPEPTASTSADLPEDTTSTPAVQLQTTVTEAELDVQPSPTSSTVVDQQDSSPSETPSECSVETIFSEPCQTALGTISATFYDIAGAYLGVKSKAIDVPAHVHINITSQARRFDPRDLIPQIRALADMVQGLSDNSSANARPIQNGVGRGVGHGLVGVRMADDGLWEEL